jgi:hypothetical protein
VIFAEFYGPSSLFREVRPALAAGIAAVFRTRPEDVVIRGMELDTDHPALEVWIELSSEEQLVRHGSDLARQVTGVVRAHTDRDVWVLFRIVPLERVYLNGEPRRRGAATLE